MEEVRSEKLWTTFPIHLFSKQYAEKHIQTSQRNLFLRRFLLLGSLADFLCFGNDEDCDFVEQPYR